MKWKTGVCVCVSRGSSLEVTAHYTITFNWLAPWRGILSAKIIYCVIRQSKLNVWMPIATENERNEFYVRSQFVIYTNSIKLRHANIKFMGIHNFQYIFDEMTVRTCTTGRPADEGKKWNGTKSNCNHTLYSKYTHIHSNLNWHLHFSSFNR